MDTQLGSKVDLDITVTDPDGTPTAATVTLTLTDPSGNSTSPSVSDGTNTGDYVATVTPDAVGVWFYEWQTSGAVTSESKGQFVVLDPAPPTYATLSALKTRMGIDVTDTTRDEELLGYLTAAAEILESDCGGRRFTLDQTATSRIFNIRGRTLWTPEGEKLFIDDIGTLTDLVVEVGNPQTSTWTTITDYQTGPENALAYGRPIEWLIRWPIRWSHYPLHRLRVTAHWGWPRVPAKASQGNLIGAQRLARRKDSPEGTAGYQDLGSVKVSIDADYEKCIASLRTFGWGS